MGPLSPSTRWCRHTCWPDYAQNLDLASCHQICYILVGDVGWRWWIYCTHAGSAASPLDVGWRRWIHAQPMQPIHSHRIPYRKRRGSLLGEREPGATCIQLRRIHRNISIGDIKFDLADESSKFLNITAYWIFSKTHHKKCHWGHRSNMLIDPYPYLFLGVMTNQR